MSKRKIFDFDGTIANSAKFVTSYLAREAGVPMTLQLRQDLSGLSMRSIARELRIPKRQFLSLFVNGRRAMGEHMDEIEAFTGIKDALHTLYEEGGKQKFFAVSSNSKKNVKLFLQQNNLDQYFADIKGNASVLGKARSLRKMLRRNDLRPEDCVYIGDEVGDLIAAHKVGVLAVAVTWGYNSEEVLAGQHPVAIVHEPAELVKLLQKL
jgi:phosphoglycolate phosphatase